MIALEIKRATNAENKMGILNSFKFIVEQEFEESGKEATRAQLQRRGFHVKPEDVNLITTLLESAITTINA